MKSSIPSLTAVALSVAMVFGAAATQAAQSQSAVQPQAATTNAYWWPQQLDLSPLRQHGAESNPYGADYDYAKLLALWIWTPSKPISKPR